MTESIEPDVTPVSRIGFGPLRQLFAGQGLELVTVAAKQAIPGTFWGEPEAGLMGDQLFARADTPVHSVLHEGSHWLCMDSDRRSMLDRDAGSTDVEEHAVCYLQCLLADRIDGYSMVRCFADMDAWGYHFALGSAQAFFERDSDDAQAFLAQAGVADRLGIALDAR